jgi:hypothetical protein
LDSTFADNLDDATTVFSGTLSVPAGLLAGDWTEIPLTESFIYNGTDNLVIYTRSDGGTATNNVFTSGPDAILYLNRHSYVWDNTSTTGFINNYLTHQRLWITPYQ